MRAKCIYKIEDVEMTVSELSAFIGATRREVCYWAEKIGITTNKNEPRKWRRFNTTDIACLLLLKRLRLAGLSMWLAIDIVIQMRRKMTGAVKMEV